FAGVAAVMRASQPGVTAGHIRQWVRLIDRQLPGTGTGVGAASAPPPPAALGPSFLPPPAPAGRPLSPNAMRALRYSEYALDEKLRRGDPDPHTIISSPGGTYVVTPGTRPAPDPRLAPAVGTSGTSSVGASSATRPPPPHAPWRTPTPRQLADLLRAG